MRRLEEACEAQELLVSAFSSGNVAGADAPIVRIDTHISHVFLSGEFAFKLKRAVRYPFVDFEALEARRAACEEEMSINASFASELYIGVKPVTCEADGGFALDGAGPAVDWVVQMRRFDQVCQFDRLADAGELTRHHVEGAARMVARAHASADPQYLAGHAVDYRGVVEGLRRTEQHGAANMGIGAGSPLLFDKLEFELGRVSGLIEQRRRCGKVRRGHGDLHLRNMCLFEGKPTLFDALEFDERLATTDVIYDLAFLLMDLRRAGLAEHANAAMNAYWDEAGEEEGALALLPFFTALRAAVRMAVAVEAGDLTGAAHYRRLGLDLLERAPPIVLALGGLSGVGKTAIAQGIAPRLPGPAGARLLRSDVLRKRQALVRLDALANEKFYEPEQRARIYRDLAAHALEATQSGASVVADATFRENAARDSIEAASRHALFHACWLDAPLAVRLARVAKRTGDASDADVSVALAQRAPQRLPKHWRKVDAAGAIADSVAEILRQTVATGDAGRSV